jgi:hypothetical protein
MARILIIRKHKTNNMKRYYILAFYILLVAGTATAQEETISLTLQQAIEIAQEHSPQAQAARHTYRAAYWNYRFFRANYLPSVTLSSSPNLNPAGRHQPVCQTEPTEHRSEFENKSECVVHRWQLLYQDHYPTH